MKPKIVAVINTLAPFWKVILGLWMAITCAMFSQHFILHGYTMIRDHPDYRAYFWNIKGIVLQSVLEGFVFTGGIIIFILFILVVILLIQRVQKF